MKKLHWISSCLEDLRQFPDDVRSEAGYALYVAQQGGKSLSAIPLVGFGGAKILEVVIDNDGNTFRAVYTVKFPKAVYALHAFQKKSPRGSETPKPDMERIRLRLKLAEAHYQLHYASEDRNDESANVKEDGGHAKKGRA